MRETTVVLKADKETDELSSYDVEIEDEEEVDMSVNNIEN